MVNTELLKDGTLIRHYSDMGKMILQVETGIMYTEAVDVVPCLYTYEESDTPIGDSEEASEVDYLAALERFGVK